jgi:glycosyltransferase involved in cell wall biosynthesis
MFDSRLQRARNLLISRGCRKIILYIWRPEFGCALNSIPFDLSCYHIDDEYSFSDVELEIDPGEAAMIKKVDQVFIHSPGLMEKKGTINPHTTFIPNGVDFTAYANPAPEPHDLASIPRPRIGYTGYIKKQLDWPLILELAKRHKEWSFVFVGPKSPHPEILAALQELSSFHNVYFLGAKSTWALAAYPQHFDACIMPYRVNAYTNNIYPLKLHEYLASGRPIVSSLIRSLREFSKVIALANGFEEWSNALTRTLEPAASCPEAAAARRRIACEFDWNKLAQVIAQSLCDSLGSPAILNHLVGANSHLDRISCART